MLNKKSFVSQKGMTLVELLAAITILGIVFIGLLSIFPQMTNSNKQTEEKLETMNLARMELVDFKEGLKTLKPEDKENTDADPNDDIITYKYAQNEYHYEVDYYETPDLNKNEHTESVELNKIHIRVMKNDNLISETFGYLKISNLE